MRVLFLMFPTTYLKQGKVKGLVAGLCEAPRGKSCAESCVRVHAHKSEGRRNYTGLEVEQLTHLPLKVF